MKKLRKWTTAEVVRIVFLIIYIVLAVIPHKTYPLDTLRYGMLQGFLAGVLITLTVFTFGQEE